MSWVDYASNYSDEIIGAVVELLLGHDFCPACEVVLPEIFQICSLIFATENFEEKKEDEEKQSTKNAAY